jgi:CRISPR-associated protein Cas5h
MISWAEKGTYMKLFSFELSGQFAFFKKNDFNDVFQVSYNFIHKPVVLGIIGAILGFKGYTKQKELPEYYKKLHPLKISIVPHYKEPLPKQLSVFNNASGLGSKEKGAWQIREQILVGKPMITYTIYVLDDHSVEDSIISRLKEKLKKGETVYNLYFGKNEFFAYHQNFFDAYKIESLTESECIIDSLINKGDGDETVSFIGYDFDTFDSLDFGSPLSHTVFEYLPIKLDNMGFYEKEMFILTQRRLRINRSDGFYRIIKYENALVKTTNVQFI